MNWTGNYPEIRVGKQELLRSRRKAENPELHPLHPLLRPEHQRVLYLRKGLPHPLKGRSFLKRPVMCAWQLLGREALAMQASKGGMTAGSGELRWRWSCWRVSRAEEELCCDGSCAYLGPCAARRCGGG
ncbi:hypothetical protein Taro_036207 [Colocasia esculenta]|uniref:Uncharacterized protein n=1 Tax=Colocasia esculenta TaxID=4460 RepID=A0A843WH54_COLES|nr:hypothetical protein [Colocasia esculenta]